MKTRLNRERSGRQANLEGISSVGERVHAILGLASLNAQPLWSAILTAVS